VVVFVPDTVVVVFVPDTVVVVFVLNPVVMVFVLDPVVVVFVPDMGVKYIYIKSKKAVKNNSKIPIVELPEP
jgi:hypothetical protein